VEDRPSRATLGQDGERGKVPALREQHVGELGPEGPAVTPPQRAEREGDRDQVHPGEQADGLQHVEPGVGGPVWIADVLEARDDVADQMARRRGHHQDGG